MVNIAICDDEKIQLNLLKNIINVSLSLKGVEYKIFEFGCGERLVEATSKTNYDIIFLDIEMKALDGINTAKNIRLHNKTSIIVFVTAYPDFVFQGYEVKALNYILKPYKAEKIAEVLNSALEELEETQDKFYTVELKSGTQLLNLNNTIYFVSDKRKINAVTLSGRINFYGKLDHLEKKMPSFFTRIHRSYLININYVSAVEGSTITVNGENLPLSRSRQKPFMIEFAKTILR